MDEQLYPPISINEQCIAANDCKSEKTVDYPIKYS